MNVVRLMGGLGNQLFQYAFGRAMAKNGIEVKYDITNFGKSKHREYMLGNFKVQIEFSSFVNSHGKLDSGKNPSFNMDYLKMNGYNFFGYWQYLAYFKNLIPEFRKEMCVKEEAYTDDYLKLKDIILNTESVSVHVRRDDYLTSNSIPDLPFVYYKEALKKVKGSLFIFSDDMNWCRAIFKKEYFGRDVYFGGLPYYLDFELMRLCKHNIIANSTFSWWAAILNDNPDKVVVTPDFWITRLDRHERNNFPNNWIKINV
jgi:hypothetical protein